MRIRVSFPGILRRGRRREQQPGAQQHQPSSHDQPIGLLGKKCCGTGLFQNGGQLVNAVRKRETRQIDRVGSRQAQQHRQWPAEAVEFEVRRVALPSPTRCGLGRTGVHPRSVQRSRPQHETQRRPARAEARDRRMRCFAGGEEPIPDDGMPGRQAPPRPRLGPHADLAPVGRQPGERLRVGRTQLEDARRHRQQRMEVQRAGAAAPNQADRFRVVRLDPLAELAREEVATGDRQTPLGYRLRCGQVEDVFLDAREIEAPRDDTRPMRRRDKARDRLGRAADRQVMVEPVRCGCG